MRRALLAVLVAGVALSVGVRPSGADFVAGSSSGVNSFTTAADFNTVTVSLDDPGTPLRGVVALSATAASDRGIASVTFESAPSGSTGWQPLCVDTAAPYACDFDTTTVVDSLRDIRVVALDDAGYARSALVAGRRIDNTAPNASISNPGTPLKDTVVLQATATDAGSGLEELTVQRKLASDSGWTDVCTTASSPLSCSVDTTTLADGLWDFRAVAADAAGNTGSSAVTGRRVDNTAPTIALDDPGPMGATVSLTSTAVDAGTGVAGVRYEHRPAGGGAWTTACTAAAAPFTCAFATGSLADGSYDLRAIAADGGGLTTTSATVASVRVDNAAPTSVTMADPGAALQGAVGLTGTASDAGSGIASVRFQYAPAGTAAWSDACADSTAPFAACSWDTTLAADGLYDMRALATDAAGNTTASATRTSRRVDNVAPAVTMTDPGTPLRASVTLGATAGDGGGIASVAIHHKPTSGSTWTLVCSDATAPYQCAWNTAGVADGAYDLRATATDASGRTATSTVTGRQVDNTGPRASAVTATNGGTSGTLGAGDRLSLSYTEAIAPGSLIPGWAGAGRSVSLTFARSGADTTVVVTDPATGATVPVGALSVTGRWSSGGPGATFDGTLTLSGATLTLDLGALASGGVTAATPLTTLSWTSTTAVADVAGNAGVATAVTGTGTL